MRFWRCLGSTMKPSGSCAFMPQTGSLRRYKAHLEGPSPRRAFSRRYPK